MLGHFFDGNVAPFAPKLVKNLACYQHLEFSSCGAVGLREVKLETILVQNYQGQFFKGFEAKEIAERGITIGLDPKYFIACFNDSSKIQVRANNKERLDESLIEDAITQTDRDNIIALFDLNKMDVTEIKDTCIKIRPYMAGVFDTWSDSNMNNFTLTSVGIAIGHANIKRLVGEFANLSMWIN